MGQSVLDAMDQTGEFLSKHKKKIMLTAAAAYCYKNPDKCNPETVGKFMAKGVKPIGKALGEGAVEGASEELERQVKRVANGLSKEDIDCFKQKFGLQNANPVEVVLRALVLKKRIKTQGSFEGYASVLGLPVHKLSGVVEEALTFIHDECRKFYEGKYMKGLINYDYVSNNEGFREAIFQHMAQDKQLSQSDYLTLKRWYNGATKDDQGRVQSAPPESTDHLMKTVFGVTRFGGGADSAKTRLTYVIYEVLELLKNFDELNVSKLRQAQGIFNEAIPPKATEQETFQFYDGLNFSYYNDVLDKMIAYLNEGNQTELKEWHEALIEQLYEDLTEHSGELWKKVGSGAGILQDFKKVVKNLPVHTLAKIAGAILGAGLTLKAIAQIPAEGYVEINAMQDYIKKNRGASLSDYAKSGKAGPLDKGHERYMGTQWQIYWKIATALLTINRDGIKMNPKIAFALQKLRI